MVFASRYAPHTDSLIFVHENLPPLFGIPSPFRRVLQTKSALKSNNAVQDDVDTTAPTVRKDSVHRWLRKEKKREPRKDKARPIFLGEGWIAWVIHTCFAVAFGFIFWIRKQLCACGNRKTMVCLSFSCHGSHAFALPACYPHLSTQRFRLLIIISLLLLYVDRIQRARMKNGVKPRRLQTSSKDINGGSWMNAVTTGRTTNY